MLIDEYRGRLAVKGMCKLMKVSRTAYYNWSLKTLNTEVDCLEGKIYKEIEDIVVEFPGYGYRRVTAELKRKGKTVNHKKVLRLMREKNLTKKRKRRYTLTTDSTHGLEVYPNLTKEFIPTSVNELWVADITYIRLRREFAYLSAILDAFSRRVIGWSLGGSLGCDLALKALRMALMKRDFSPGLIHHSDRGVQYASKEYVSLLTNHGIRISMAAKGNPYDNAQAESFIATLKKEEVNLSEYENIQEARSCIGSFIEDLYNRKRLHSSLGYMPPEEFENKLSTDVCLT